MSLKDLKIIKEESIITDEKDVVLFKTNKFTKSIKVLKLKNIPMLKHLIMSNDKVDYITENNKVFLKFKSNILKLPLDTNFCVQKNPKDNTNIIVLFKKNKKLMLKTDVKENTLIEILNKKEIKEIIKLQKIAKKENKNTPQTIITEDEKQKSESPLEIIKNKIFEDFIQTSNVHPLKELLNTVHQESDNKEIPSLSL